MILLSSANVFAEEIDINIDTGKIVDGVKAILGEVLAKFKDLKSSDWFTETVANLSNLGIISGYPDGTFRPQGDVTTAEYIKLLLETSGIEYDKATNPWYEGLMDKAKEMNIITSSLYNSPNSPIKRKDVAVVLSKLIDKTSSLRKEFVTERSKEFSRFKYLIYDTTKLSQEYKDSIYKLFEYELIIGSTNEKDQVFYNPESNLTRAEVATIIERLIEPAKRLDKYAEYPNRNNVFTRYHTGSWGDNERPLLFSDLTSSYNFNADTENERLTFNYQRRLYEYGKEEAEPAQIVDGVKYYYEEDLYESFTDVELSKKLNPKIDKQLYNLIKYSIDENDYSEMVLTGYGDPDWSRVIYSHTKSERRAANGSQEWMFIFREMKPSNIKQSYPESKLKHSENAPIYLQLGSVWRDRSPNEGHIDWRFANKLRMNFIAIFGDEAGHKIYEYVLNEYIKYREAGSADSTGRVNVFKVKDIDNIHIDYITGTNAILNFYFSYR